MPLRKYTETSRNKDTNPISSQIYGDSNAFAPLRDCLAHVGLILFPFHINTLDAVLIESATFKLDSLGSSSESLDDSTWR